MRTLLPVLVLAVGVSACSKDEDPTPSPAPGPSYGVSDFSQLAVGNYWVYQKSNLDTAGNVSAVTANYDSLFVSGTTDVNGVTYAVLSKALNGTVILGMEELRRDSADCMVDGNGRIVFRYGVFDQIAWTYVDPFVFRYEWYLSSATNTINVPAGTFSAHSLNCELTQLGTIPVPPADRDQLTWWAPGVGKVRDDSYYALSGTGVRRDLVRYLVQ